MILFLQYLLLYLNVFVYLINSKLLSRINTIIITIININTTMNMNTIIITINDNNIIIIVIVNGVKIIL